jgi:hypothetical protein
MKNLINCTSSDFDFFSEQKTQNMIRDGVLTYFPADLKSDTQATILIEGSPQFLDLSKAQLYVKVKVYKYDKSTNLTAPLSNTDTISLTNNTLHSLWSQIDLYLNDAKVENKMFYGLQSYIQDLLNHNREYKQTCLQAQGWFDDEAGQMNNVTLIKNESIQNQEFNRGLVQRRNLLNTGEVEFMGAPHLDLFNNGKFLLNQTKMSLVLTQNSDNFVLMGSGDYRIKVIKAGLWVKKLTANDSIQNAVNMQLEKSFANYDINLTKVITRKIETAGLGETLQICTGLIPKTVILGIADYQSTVIGKVDKNPFNFHHHNLKSINLMENGRSYPYSGALDFNFGKKEYLSGFKSLETHSKSIYGNGISREDFAGGYALYVFDMTPNGECSEIIDVDRSGNLSVALEFTEESGQPLVLVCYLEYNNTIQLDKLRNFVVDSN